jgi:hypothetical protein
MLVALGSITFVAQAPALTSRRGRGLSMNSKKRRSFIRQNAWVIAALSLLPSHGCSAEAAGHCQGFRESGGLVAADSERRAGVQEARGRPGGWDRRPSALRGESSALLSFLAVARTLHGDQPMNSSFTRSLLQHGSGALMRFHCLSEATVGCLLKGDFSIQCQVRWDLFGEAQGRLEQAVNTSMPSR